MKKKIFFLILCFLVVFPQFLHAQNKKPKIVLVLSGGGAKGIAHIPTLQILDSLGIVPDLVIGTSMGAVVGGFYSMGYSGDSIAQITKNAKWDELLGGKVSLTDVSVEEKNEFGRYMVDFDWVKGKPKVNSALLSDQNLREFLSTYATPVYRINDFDKLPIPYRAMTTDIVNGKELIMDKGSISLAMRASMSIPTIFKPVEYNNTLLVDGGILNNFPTDIAKKMGADIIIGSDVGGGLESKEKLDKMSSILFQTSMLTSLIKNPGNRDLCDILIDHTPNLTYSTGDFTKSNEIYEEGKIAAYQNMDAFVAIADKIKSFKQRTHKLPIVPQKFTINDFVYKNISAGNIDLVKYRANLVPNKEYTVEEIKNGIDRAMGTQLFSQINFSPIFEDDQIKFEVEGYEKAKHQIKGSLHYDTQRGVGLIVNYTGRNIIGEASRFLVTLDIAQQPGFRIHYQNNFGHRKEWWWSSEILGQLLTQEFYHKGVKAEYLDNDFFQFDNEFNKNINSLKSFYGLGLNFESTSFKPANKSEISDNVFGLEDYNFKNMEINFHFDYNTLNKVFFPTKGRFLYAELSRSLYHHVKYDFSDHSKPNIDGKTNGFTKFNLSFEQRLPLHHKITGIIGASAGFTFVDKIQEGEHSYLDFGTGDAYFIGGHIRRPRKDTYLFRGLNDSELFVSQFMMLNLGLQTHLTSSLLLTPHFNVASVGNTGFSDYIKDAFSPDGDWQDLDETSLLLSGGITASYDSFLGPVNFDVSYVNRINKIRIFFGIGIPLNRSN
ncbi:MAG: patatin-like phospholipase family protein [Flavobacteriaceae bacterium]|nr:patatin-like phospholipase family protein [Flavobacteriaceae bacterium]